MSTKSHSPRLSSWHAVLVVSLLSVFFLPGRVALGQEDYSWVDAPDVRGGVQGGNEPDGQALYVAAGFHRGKWIIGKARDRECWVPWDGSEHVCRQMKKLVCDRARWVDAHGEIPPNAVSLDEYPGGPRYYVARGRYHETWIPGKTRADARHCWVSFAGKEHIVSQYQVLVNGGGQGRHDPSGDPDNGTVAVYVIPHSSVGDARVRDYLRTHDMRRTRDIESADAVLAVCKCYASNNLAPRYDSVQDLEQAIDKENSTWSNGPNLGIYLYEHTTDGGWKRR